MNISGTLNKEAAVGSDQRLSESGINRENTKPEMWNNATLHSPFRSYPLPLLDHLPDLWLQTFYLESTSNFFIYNKCRIILMRGWGKEALVLYITSFQGKLQERRKKAFKYFVMLPIKSETCFPQPRHCQTHSAKLPAHSNTGDWILADFLSQPGTVSAKFILKLGDRSKSLALTS